MNNCRMRIPIFRRLSSIGDFPFHRMARKSKPLLSLFATALYLEISAIVGMAGIPSFAAEGTISNQAFNYGQTNAYLSLEAKVRFSYSNGWWDVEIKYPHSAKGAPLVQSCRRIPNGIRFYTLFEGTSETALTAAYACPLTYPMPGIKLPFAAWLALCPRPELPLLDDTHMHRFLNVPTCQLDLFTHVQNVGEYALEYLGTQKQFLSRLTVTNNGISLGIGGDNTHQVLPFRPPFEDGFLEMQYEVLESTNINGWQFPARSILREWQPMLAAKTNADLHLATLIVTTLERITVSVSNADAPLTPAKLLAFDYRPRELPRGRSVLYVVTNDQWKPVGDRKIVRLTATERSSARIQGENDPAGRLAIGRGNIVVIIVIGALVVAPIVLSLRKPKSRQKNTLG